LLTELYLTASLDGTACLFQARRLICDRLASFLSLKATTQPDVDRRTVRSDPVSTRRSVGDGNPSAEDSVPNHQALTSLFDRLETRISLVEEKREKFDKDTKMRREWMLVAAVIDRLCFIALIIVFVGGTLVFVVLFFAS